MAAAGELTAELDAGLRRPVQPVHAADPRWPGHALGVDVRKVVELGITPKVTTGILHNRDGSGQVGAGVAEAPLGCFREALAARSTRA